MRHDIIDYLQKEVKRDANYQPTFLVWDAIIILNR